MEGEGSNRGGKYSEWEGGREGRIGCWESAAEGKGMKGGATGGKVACCVYKDAVGSRIHISPSPATLQGESLSPSLI